MADEFTLQYSLSYAKGNATASVKPGSLKLPQATQGYFQTIQTINTTAEENVTFANLTIPSLLAIQSMEATTTGNFVVYGPNSTAYGGMVPFGRLGPKDIHHLRLTSTGPTLRMQANTAAVNVAITAFEL
jgi:hypothetical protein